MIDNVAPQSQREPRDPRRGSLRQQAEDLVRRVGMNLSSLNREELQQLVNELRVREMELELANLEAREQRLELAGAREWYKSLFESAPVGHVILDSSGTVLESNRSAASLLGLERDAIVGASMSRFISPEFSREWDDYLQAVFHQKSAQLCELTLRRGDGCRVVVRLESIYQPSFVSGTPRCLTVLINITERWAGRFQLRELNEPLGSELCGAEEAQRRDSRRDLKDRAEDSLDLERREHRFHSLSDQVPAVHFYIDRDLRYRYINHHYEVLYPRPANEIIGKTVAQLLGPRGEETAQSLIDAALQGQESSFESELTLADGSHRMRARYVPDVNEQGEVVGVFVLVTDISVNSDVEKYLVDRTSELTMLCDIAWMAYTVTDVEAAFSYVLERISQHNGWRCGHAWLPSAEQEDELIPSYCWYDEASNLFPGLNEAVNAGEYRRGSGLVGRVFANGRLELSNHLEDLPLHDASPLGGADVKTVLVFPILVADQVVGVLGFFSETEFRLTETVRTLMTGVGLLLGHVVERKQAEVALRQSEAQTRAVLAALPAHIAVFDRTGVIMAVNPAWDEFARQNQGVADRCGVGCNYLDVCRNAVGRGADFADKTLRGLQKVLAGELDQFELEYPCHSESSRRWFLMQASLLRDGSGAVVVAHTDISSRVHSELAFREEHHFSESILDTAKQIVLVIDREGKIVRFNKFMEELTGWRLKEVKGKDYFETFLRPKDRQRLRKLFQQAMDGTPTGGAVSAIVAKEGQEYEIEWYDAVLTDHDGDFVGLLCMGIDVTERQKLHREILEIAAEEQRWIGQELHDSTQQQLIGLTLLAHHVAEKLEAAATSADPDAGLDEDRLKSLREKSRQLELGLQDAARQVNMLSRGLMPVEVDAHGLASSLHELTRQISQANRFHCRFHGDESVEVRDNYVATNLFRIAQEAMTNAIKHSGASHIGVSLQREGEQVVLKVIDNGSGFEDNKVAPSAMGLRIMAHRANSIGGDLSIHALPEGGTEVVCTIATGDPLP